MSDWLRQCFPGASRPQPRRAGASSQATAVPTAGTEVYMPIIWHMRGWDSCRVALCLVLKFTAPTKALFFSMDRCQIVAGVGGGAQKRDIFFGHDANITPLFFKKKKIELNTSFYSFFFSHLYWSIIALQWCVSFCFITKWISYTYIYVPCHSPFNDHWAHTICQIQGRSLCSHYPS